MISPILIRSQLSHHSSFLFLISAFYEDTTTQSAFDAAFDVFWL